MTLYIYRVWWTYPARNPITDLNLQRVLVVLGFQVDRSDQSVLPDRLHGPDRSDLLKAPVRPVCSTSTNFGRQQSPRQEAKSAGLREAGGSAVCRDMR